MPKYPEEPTESNLKTLNDKLQNRKAVLQLNDGLQYRVTNLVIGSDSTSFLIRNGKEGITTVATCSIKQIQSPQGGTVFGVVLGAGLVYSGVKALELGVVFRHRPLMLLGSAGIGLGGGLALGSAYKNEMNLPKCDL